MEIVRLVDSNLSLRMRVASPFFVTEFAGAADDSGQAALREWTGRMAEEPESVVVLEMGGLDSLSSSAASTLTRGLREAQRLDKGVRLVRCRQTDFDRLRAAGLRGEIWHCGSLFQATEGTLGSADAATRLHLRADDTSLRHLGVMLAALAGKLKLPPERAEGLRAAVLEATTNAIHYGSPRGSGDTISLYFHRLPGQLVVEVQDRGAGLPPREGEGIGRMRRLVDEVEFLPNPTGLLTRLTVGLPSRWE